MKTNKKTFLHSYWNITYDENIEDWVMSGEVEYLGFIAGYGAKMLHEYEFFKSTDSNL